MLRKKFVEKYNLSDATWSPFMAVVCMSSSVHHLKKQASSSVTTFLIWTVHIVGSASVDNFVNAILMRNKKIALISIKNVISKEILSPLDVVLCVFLPNLLHFEQFNENRKTPIYLCVKNTTWIGNKYSPEISELLYSHSYEQCSLNPHSDFRS